MGAYGCQSALRLKLNDLPATFADLVSSHWRHRTSGGEYGSSARTCAMYLSRDGNERPLLNISPSNVVDRKRRNNIPVAGNIDRLPPECNKGYNATQLFAARRKNLRAPAMVKSNVARTSHRRVFYKRGGVLRIKL